jgi:isochorismate hydrolase
MARAGAGFHQGDSKIGDLGGHWGREIPYRERQTRIVNQAAPACVDHTLVALQHHENKP